MVLRHVPSSAFLFLPSAELRALEVANAEQADENWIWCREAESLFLSYASRPLLLQ